MSFNNQLL
jgi:hypothetical protein